MPVSRKGRVQVDSGIRAPSARTYTAEAVPHIDPQRKESQAANYERLASALGQFNSALQGAGRAIDGAMKRAEDRAKKLEQEKEAAEKRKQRQASGGRRGGGGGGRRRGSGKKRLSREQWIENKRAEYEKKNTLENKSGSKVVNEPVHQYDNASVNEADQDRNDPGSGKRILGQENATYETYKELNDVKAGIGKDFDNEAKNLIADERSKGYRVPVEDEHGEPERNADGSVKTRLRTAQEIEHEHVKQQAQIDIDYGDTPLVRRHLKGQNVIHMNTRLKYLAQAEEADRKNQAVQFVQNTSFEEITRLHEEGASPDEIAHAVVQSGLNNAQNLSANVTRDEVVGMVMGSLKTGLKEKNNLPAARAVMAFVQGSPDAANGVTSWLKHPKWGKEMDKLVRQASKIVAEDTARTKGNLAVKEYMEKRSKGQDYTFAPITYEVNGEKHVVTVAEQKAEAANYIESKILTVDGEVVDGTMSDVQRQRFEAMKIPKLVEAFEDNPGLRSPSIEKAFKAFHVNLGQTMDPKDPNFPRARAFAIEMLNRGPDGERMLSQYLDTKHMLKFYKMAAALERAGPISDEDVLQKLNVYLEHRNRNGVVKLTKERNALIKGWGDDLDEEDRQLALEITKMDTLDEDVSDEEFMTRLNGFADNIVKYNPEYNGVKFNARGLTTSVDKFLDNIKFAMPKFKEKFGLNDIDESQMAIKSVGNGLFVLTDTNGNALRDGKTKRTLYIREPLINEVGGDMREKERLRLAKEKREFREGGGYLGWMARGIGMGDYFREDLAAKVAGQEAEMGEIEKIVSETKRGTRTSYKVDPNSLKMGGRSR